MKASDPDPAQRRWVGAGGWCPPAFSPGGAPPPSVPDGGGPVHVHRLTETKTPSAEQQESGGGQGAHLHVQLQDVRVRPQQLTHVGTGASKVPVDKLLDVAAS